MDTISGPWAIIAIVIFGTAFLKILTSLSVLRFALGLRGMGFGLVVVLVSGVLALLTASPKALEGHSIAGPQDIVVVQREFLEKNSDPTIRDRLGVLQAQIDHRRVEKPSEAAEVVKAPTSERPEVLLAAFIISELRAALMVGILFLIPFVLVDVVVANILALLQMTQIPALVVSFPVKLLLFVSLDGVRLVMEKLLGSYG